jgi:hypothetical protein
VSRTFDADLRSLERAYWTDPDDPRVARRYLAALRRAGRAKLAAQVRFRLGERTEACAELGIRWEAERPPTTSYGHQLQWRGKSLSPGAVRELVAEDLAAFDPTRLAASWPTRKDGSFRLNTTQFLRRYPAHESDAPHRRLILIAWTPGTSTLYERPEDRGKHLITVGLETRSTRKKLLDPARWRG